MPASTRTVVSPFQAGFGVSPPVLAGREPEQSVLNTALHRLCETQSGGCVILSGPRGNGKTALLKWL
ncbi:MAG: ATP-binding protein, partial [Gammaproteobacteria bacterium]|nr:ATP-binding protein [Gammaproteobacteria bacterium]